MTIGQSMMLLDWQNETSSASLVQLALYNPTDAIETLAIPCNRAPAPLA